MVPMVTAMQRRISHPMELCEATCRHSPNRPQQLHRRTDQNNNLQVQKNVRFTINRSALVTSTARSMVEFDCCLCIDKTKQHPMAFEQVSSIALQLIFATTGSTERNKHCCCILCAKRFRIIAIGLLTPLTLVQLLPLLQRMLPSMPSCPWLHQLPPSYHHPFLH